MQLLDGKKTANDIKEEIAVQVQSIVSSAGKVPHLSAILVGSDGASETYIAAKVKACQKVGFKSTLIRLDKSVSEEEKDVFITCASCDASFPLRKIKY